MIFIFRIRHLSPFRLQPYRSRAGAGGGGCKEGFGGKVTHRDGLNVRQHKGTVPLVFALFGVLKS